MKGDWPVRETKPTPLILDDRMREVSQHLRYLCSCEAEAMSDYERINLLVKAGNDAAALLDEMRRR